MAFKNGKWLCSGAEGQASADVDGSQDNPSEQDGEPLQLLGYWILPGSMRYTLMEGSPQTSTTDPPATARLRAQQQGGAF